MNRADVEWLLANHDNGRGPIDWSDESQRERGGLDLRGADLRHLLLDGLPLARMCGGLTVIQMLTIPWLHKEAAILLQETLLGGTQLQGAILGGAQMQKAYLGYAQLQEAKLSGAQLQEAYLGEAELQKAYLGHAQLQEANLARAQLQEAYLGEAQLQKAILGEAQLQEANLSGAQLQETLLFSAQLQGASFHRAKLEDAILDGATLSDEKYGAVHLADVRWGDVNLAVVDWKPVKTLGNERQARQKKGSNGKIKGKRIRLSEYQNAVRANRQLAVVLRNQGLNEEARFAYRAQLMQRKVFWYQRKFWQYLGSLFLDLLSGYGYRWWRSFLAYLLVITVFATTYFIIGHKVGPVLSPLGSFVFSVTSFHGRGFFPGGIGLDDPLTVLAALEAFIGLLIEITLIATLTQRLFGK